MSTKSAKSFRCSEKGCGKAFSRRDYLTRHKANHSLVKPFPCLQCQLHFSRKDVLEKHYRSRSHQNKRAQLTTEYLNPVSNPMSQETYQSEGVARNLKLLDSEYSSLNSPLDASIDWLFGDIINAGGDNLELHGSDADGEPPLRETNSAISPKDLESRTLNEVERKLGQLGVINYNPESFPQYIDNFGKYFIPIYPIIHQATFDANNINTWLLIAIFSVGMAFSSDVDDYSTALSINGELKLHIFKDIGDNTHIELELLQALLIDNFCCKLLGDANQMKMSQIFHGTSINFLRLEGHFNKRASPDVSSVTNIDDPISEILWHEWVKFETFKRTAFFGFILDCQNSSLFRDSQLLSIFEIHLELPSSDSLWNCRSHFEFYPDLLRQPKELHITTKPSWIPKDDSFLQKISANENNKNKYSKPSMLHLELEGNWPSFLWSLRRLMQPYEKVQKEYETNCFSQFSRLILLHGVFSIMWDLKSRSLLDLGFVSKRSLSLLLSRLNYALMNWKGYFEKQTKLSNLAAVETDQTISILNDYGVSNLFWNSVTLFQFARITLNADLTSILQLRTDFVKSNGSVSTNKTTNESKMLNIQSWTRTLESRKAVNAACKILNNIFNNIEVTIKIPFLARILYFACLTIWAYEVYIEIKTTIGHHDKPRKLSKHKYSGEDGAIASDLLEEDIDKYIMSVLEASDYESVTEDRDFNEYWEVQQQVIGLMLFTSNVLDMYHLPATDDLRANLIDILNFY